MTSLRFRNVDVSSSDPVGEWPFEAVQAAVERGGLSVWRRLASEVESDPWGPVARRIEEVLAISRPYGVSDLLDDVIGTARERSDRAERVEVARRVRTLVESSGLSRQEFATAIGTSTSRLSTYVNGRVSPSAALVVRMERVVARRGVGHDARAVGEAG